MGLSEIMNKSAVAVISTKIFRILKYLVNLCADFVCRIALLNLFIFYECFLKISTVWENIYWASKDWFSISLTEDSSEIRSFLEDHKRTFKKIPDHLVVILGPEKPSHEDLAKLISWCEPLGIRFISFYDHKNGIQPLAVFEAVKKSNKHVIHKIKWGKSFTDDIKQASIKQINGYRWEGLIRVNVLDWGNTNEELVEATKELYLSKCDSSSVVDQATLNLVLKRRLGAPAPDLAIVCGPALSYFACTPWHLRLTQFVHIQSHHSIKVSKFLNCLHQYSNSEQRFGK